MASSIFPANGSGIQETIVDAKGDLIAATAADAVSRLAVGADATVLTADSTTATGLKWAAAGGGKVLQVVNVQTEAVATGTTNLPDDETIPQITEGDQYLSLSITPTSATSKLLIQIIIFGSIDTNEKILTVALFVGTTANALAASSVFSANGNRAIMVPLNHTLTAGVTTELTFRVRVGQNSTSTVTVNGLSGGRYFGAIPKSSMTITEYSL